MIPDAAAPPESSASIERVRARLLRERHRRLARQIALVTLVSVGMIVVVLINRDRQAMKRSARLAHQVAAAFQEEMERSGRLPPRIPSIDSQTDEVVRQRYLFNLFYPTQVDTQSVVGVCGPKDALQLYLRAAGRHVVLYDDGRFRAQWMPEAELRRRARSLGLESLLRE